MKIRYIALIIAGLTFLSGTFLQAQNLSNLGNHINTFGQALFYINQYYIDTVNNEKLVGNAIKETLSQLDPHSSYISAADVKALYNSYFTEKAVNFISSMI